MSYQGKQVQTIYNSGVSSSITGTVSPTSIRQFTVPAGICGPNDALEFSFFMRFSGTSDTVTIKMGSTNLFSFSTSTALSFITHSWIHFKNSTSSQAVFNSGGSGGIGSGTGAILIVSENYSSNVVWDISVTLANAANSVSIDFITMILWKQTQVQ